MENVLIHQAFEACVKREPGKVCVSEKGRDISYLLLNRRANYLAAILHAIGAGKNTVTGYLGVAGIELITALLGIFKSGGIYLPVDAALPDRRMKNMLKETACRVLITTRAYRQLVINWCKEENIQLEYIVILTQDYLETGLLKCENGEWQTIKIPCGKITEDCDYAISDEDPCYIFYTADAAGNGKPVLGWHKSLSHLVNWEIGDFGLGATVRVSQLTRIGFDDSLRDIFVPLVAGGTVYIPA